eukprot:COSAG01_NODE_93_length_27013_cov_41.515791_3_plen_161_part_00
MTKQKGLGQAFFEAFIKPLKAWQHIGKQASKKLAEDPFSLHDLMPLSHEKAKINVKVKPKVSTTKTAKKPPSPPQQQGPQKATHPQPVQSHSANRKPVILSDSSPTKQATIVTDPQRVVPPKPVKDKQLKLKKSEGLDAKKRKREQDLSERLQQHKGLEI